MTDEQARTTANVVMIAAAVGAVYVVLRTPPLRRQAFRLARAWVTGPLAMWAFAAVRQAWDESGRTAGA